MIGSARMVEVTELLYKEADLLDSSNLDEWIKLYADDGTYWMPVIAGDPYYFIVRYYGPDLDALPPGPCDRK